MSWWRVGAAVVSAVVADKRASKAEAAQEEQTKVERAIGGEKSARSKRVARAKAQTAQAELQNVAGASGQGVSSAAIVGGQEVRAQLSENIGSINRATSEANILTNAAQNVANAARVGVGERLIGTAGSIATSSLASGLGSKLASNDKDKTVG